MKEIESSLMLIIQSIEEQLKDLKMLFEKKNTVLYDENAVSKNISSIQNVRIKNMDNQIDNDYRLFNQMLVGIKDVKTILEVNKLKDEFKLLKEYILEKVNYLNNSLSVVTKNDSIKTVDECLGEINNYTIDLKNVIVKIENINEQKESDYKESINSIYQSFKEIYKLLEDVDYV